MPMREAAFEEILMWFANGEHTVCENCGPGQIISLPDPNSWLQIDS